MRTSLEISDGSKLPLDAVTQTFGVVAQRGAGKTYLTAVLCEEFAAARLPFIAIDPMGVYWGLRSSADGRHEGIPVIILGGEHGDVPLESTSGKVIADWVASERHSAVLDLSGFGKNEQRRFVTDFAEHLYHRNREPLHLILDESDLWAPQKPKGVERMLGAIEDLVRRGRARGIGLSLVTQRPAVLNKDVLTQVSVLIALRIVGAAGPGRSEGVDQVSRVTGARVFAISPVIICAVDGFQPSKKQQQILDALAWFESIDITQPSNLQVGAIALIDPSGGHFSNTVGPLSSNGMVERGSGTMRLTDAGRAIAALPENVGTLADYHDVLRARVRRARSAGGKTIEMLNVIVSRRGAEMTTEEIGEAVGIDHTGGHFSNMIGPLGTIGLIERRSGVVRPTEILFPPGLT